MVREKIVTIIIGLVVGIMLAGAYFFGPQLVSNGTSKQVTASPTPQASKSPTKAAQVTKKTLTISTPENNSSVTKSEVKISGVATPNAKIVIYSNTDQKMATVGANGKFDSTVKLEEGENEVTISDLTEPIQTKTLNITLEIQ